MSPGRGRGSGRRDANRPGGSVRDRRAAPRRGRAPSSPKRSSGGSAAAAAAKGRTRPGSRPRRPPSRQVHRRRRRILVAVLVLAVLAGGAWALLASPVLGVRAVAVTGTVALTADEVRAAAAVPLGVPLLRVDTRAIEARVEDLPRVADAAVSRSVTGVSVAVAERVPVAVVPRFDGTHLVDATVTDFATVPVPPAGLPTLEVPMITPGAPAAEAAIAVLTGLPQPLRDQVATVNATSPADVTLRLLDGREVQWGAADQAERKASVLAVLLTQAGQVYDITTPDLPTIS